MHFKYYIKTFLLSACIFLLQCNNEINNNKNEKVLIWEEKFMQLLKDTSKVNPLVDSLKKEFLSAKTDSSAIKIAIELSFRWLNESSLYLGEQAYLQSKKIGFASGESEALCRMGTAAHRMGKTTESFEYFKESIKVADEFGLKKQKAQTLAFYGNLLQGLQTHGKAYKNFQEALDLSRQVGDYNTIAFALFALADIQMERNEPKPAKINYDSALVNAIKAKNLGYESYCYSQLSKVYRMENDYPMALEYIRRSIAIANKTGIDLRISMGLQNIAELYLKMNLQDSAIEYFNQSLAFAKKRNLAFHVISSQYSIAKFYIHLKNKDSALKYITLHEKISNKINRESEISKSHQLKYYYYKEIGDTKNALYWFEQFTAVQNDIHKKEQLEAFASMELELNKEQLENDKNKQALEISLQKKIKNIFTIGFVLILFLSMLIFRSLMQNKKAKKIIEEKNIENEKQKNTLEVKNKEITDSIYYARRIQLAQIPSEKRVEKMIDKTKEKD
ncbi:MAG: tetratricopeptide repeat protein [Sphingobacteriaceae bacterium]|nr:tetratricopeptide repeat protein [Sphingobacteriaceae bacterium]